MRRPGIGGPRLEYIGVRAGEDVGHHCSRGAAHGENALGIAVVLGQSVVDHVGDAEGVASLTVGETVRVVDVPAVHLVWGASVDEDEAELVRVAR